VRHAIRLAIEILIRPSARSSRTGEKTGGSLSGVRVTMRHLTPDRSITRARLHACADARMCGYAQSVNVMRLVRDHDIVAPQVEQCWIVHVVERHPPAVG